MSDGFSPTDAMKKEALKGLAWRKEFNRGGTMVGVARARDIANGANLSLDTVKRMNSFFARHEVDKKAEGFRPGEKGFPSNGRIAWALWGGDAGKAWASSQLNLVQGATMIFPEDEKFLAHFGVKGMRWGVRKEESSGGKSGSNSENSSKAKTAAVVLASTAAVASIGVGAYYIKTRLGDSAPTGDVAGFGKDLTESLAKEPVSIIHVARGKHVGYQFLAGGGLDSPLREIESSGIQNVPGESIKRYGKRAEKVAAQYYDPLGRKDFSGRLIPHLVIIPESMAKGIDTVEQAKEATWPLIKDTFEALYDKE